MWARTCISLFDRWASIVEITLRLANNRRSVTTTASRFHLAATYNFRCLSLQRLRNDGARGGIIDRGIANIALMRSYTHIYIHTAISRSHLDHILGVRAWQCGSLWNSPSRRAHVRHCFSLCFLFAALRPLLAIDGHCKFDYFMCDYSEIHFWPGLPLIVPAPHALIDRPASLINRMSLTWKSA